MGRATKALIAISIEFLFCGILPAQNEDSDKINANVGAAVSFPLNPTSTFVNTSWGMVGGAGYNFSPRHSVIGEFMWSALYPSGSSLEPIRVAANDNLITGHSNLWTLTGNYRYQWQGQHFGAYFIGGGGWYYRTTGFTRRSVTSGSETPCTPAWMWWGFTCASGIVMANQTVGSSVSSVFGGSVGVGFTIKVGEPSYRVYIEPRYHYAPTKNVTTQLMLITVGIRY